MKAFSLGERPLAVDSARLMKSTRRNGTREAGTARSLASQHSFSSCDAITRGGSNIDRL
jgi:hypothetical protein